MIVLALLLSFVPQGETLPSVGRVVADGADVLDEPDNRGFTTDRVKAGTEVQIVREGPNGWLTVRPMPNSFSLVEEGDLEDQGNGTARILPKLATVRPGRDGARRPGPSRGTLRQGAVVRLLDRRPLMVRDGPKVETWIPIQPPKQEVRFIRAQDVDRDELRPRTPRRQPAQDADPTDEADTGIVPAPASVLGRVEPGFFATNAADESAVSPGTKAELDRIQRKHERILRRSIESWDLSAVESAYAKLLASGLEQTDRQAVEARLRIVRRQRKASDAAARIADTLSESRRRDAATSAAIRKASEAEAAIRGDYDATGLLQTSSRMVEGRRTHVLIGDDGQVVAYLLFPPGLQSRNLLARRVGVRGDAEFDEGLRAKLIKVKDIEILEGQSGPREKPSVPAADRDFETPRS